MVVRRQAHLVRTCELAVCLSLIGIASTACDPIVVDAFEPPPPPEPVDSTPLVCPPNAPKTEPGLCGCFVPDEDFDGDNAVDCLEACPDNGARIAPDGPCGCSSYADTNTCGELRDALRNLYTFDGDGVAIQDRRGDAHGTLLHVGEPSTRLDMMQLNGRLTFDGVGSYVELPAGLISNLDDATFEAWVTWRGGGNWQRIFDFGDSSGTNGVTYLFLTPLNADTGGVRVAYSVAGPNEEAVSDGDEPSPIHIGPDDNTPNQIAVVIDRTNASMRLYSDGVEIANTPQSVDLSAIRDVNNWLGRSNYSVDPALSALFIEFRIYSQALTAAQLNASYQAGPGALD